MLSVFLCCVNLQTRTILFNSALIEIENLNVSTLNSYNLMLIYMIYLWNFQASKVTSPSTIIYVCSTTNLLYDILPHILYERAMSQTGSYSTQLWSPNRGQSKRAYRRKKQSVNQVSISVVIPKTTIRNNESYWILVRFFMQIIALDRLTDPSHPIVFSEILQKTHVDIKDTKLRVTLIW